MRSTAAITGSRRRQAPAPAQAGSAGRSFAEPRTAALRRWAAQAFPELPGFPLSAETVRTAPWLDVRGDELHVDLRAMDGLTLIRLQHWVIELRCNGCAHLSHSLGPLVGIDAAAGA